MRIDELRVERAAAGEHARQHVGGRRKGSGAEAHPCHDHRRKRQRPAAKRRRTRIACQQALQARRLCDHVAPCMIDLQIGAVQAAPDYEGPRRAVPQAAEEHGDHQVDLPPHRAMAAAAQGDVEVVAQKARQRHVPAAPEVDDGRGLVRRIEVQRQTDAEQQGKADRHIRVSGEVEIDLRRVGERAEPGIHHPEGERFRQHESAVRRRRHAVGDQHLLRQTAGEKCQPFEHQGETQCSLAAEELRHHLAVMQHRAGDQVRKESDEQQVGAKRFLGFALRIGVDQVGDLRKGVERDAQRQHHVEHRSRNTQHGADRRRKKIRVLVIAERRQVGGERADQQQLAVWLRQVADRRVEKAADGVIAQDRTHQQRHDRRVPPAVEKKRRHAEPGNAGPRPRQALREQVTEPDDRQVEENEDRGIEQHGSGRFLALSRS